MKTLTELLNLKNLDHQERVKLKWDYITKHKEEEHWDYFEYITSAHGTTMTPDGWTLWSTDKCLISTLGNLLKFNKVTNSFEPAEGFNRGKYLQTDLKNLEGGFSSFRIHRAVASTFIPVPDHLLSMMGLIVADHDNDISHDNSIWNLNWMMNGDNTRKAFETGAAKVRKVIAEWALDDEFEGTRYYLDSPRQYLLGLGIDNASVALAMKGEYAYSYGFRWEVVEENTDDLPTEFPDAIKERMKDKTYLRSTLKPVMGIVVKEGPLFGFRFAMYGQPEYTANGFSGGTVSLCILGRRVKHKKCKFVTVTRKEANKLQRGLTTEQRDLIFN